MNKYIERLYNGIIKENATFVLMLGMCPTLAVTGSAVNGLGMGLTTTVVLIMSNMLISMLRKIIPDKVRIPAFIVIVASFVTIVQMLLKAYLPSLNESLGIYIPLIVVNCIILGRAEAYAYKNPVMLSVFDGIGMGLGFTLGLTLLGIFREFIGGGTIFNIQILPESVETMKIFRLAPGAFFVLAGLTAFQNKLKLKSATNTAEAGENIACGGNCAACSGNACVANHEVIESRRREQEEAAKEAKLKASEAAKTTNQPESGADIKESVQSEEKRQTEANIKNGGDKT